MAPCKEMSLVPSIRCHPEIPHLALGPKNLWNVCSILYFLDFHLNGIKLMYSFMLCFFTEKHLKMYAYYSTFQPFFFFLVSFSLHDHTIVSLLSYLFMDIWGFSSWRLLWVRPWRALSYTFLSRLWFLNLIAVNIQGRELLRVEDYLECSKVLGFCLPDARSTHPWPQVVSNINENTRRHCQIVFARGNMCNHCSWVIPKNGILWAPCKI